MNAWNKPVAVFERNLLPNELFEYLLTNTGVERICVESTNYGHLKSNHIITVIVEKLKFFPTVFLVSEYAGLLGQEIYWEK